MCVYSPPPEGDVRHAGANRRVSFRPRGFSPPRRFAPHTTAQVYCTLQPVLGFVAFQASRAPTTSRLHRAGRPGHAEPFEEFPSSTAVPCHHGLGLLGVAPDAAPASGQHRWRVRAPPQLGSSSLPRQAATSPDARRCARRLSARGLRCGLGLRTVQISEDIGSAWAGSASSLWPDRER
jgi:hypothetical protein